MRVLRYLSADYARSRIENLSFALTALLGLPVVAFARWVELGGSA